MKQKIIFDTSAFRAISLENLERLFSQGFELMAPSYCFWEVFSHLDENGNYKRIKTELMKFRYIEVLDDAYGMLIKDILKNDMKLQEHIPDNEVIHVVLRAINQSDTLKDLYDTNVEGSKGQIHLIKNSVKRGKNLLEKLEIEYQDFVKNIVKVIKEHNLKDCTLEGCHNSILSLIKGEVQNLIAKGAEENGLSESIAKEMYIFYSVIFYNSLKCSINRSNIDPNDYEDARTCLHLKLNQDIFFAVEDNNTMQALKKTLEIVKAIDDPKYFILVKTIRVCDLIRL